MELADLVVINKADLDEAAATRARAQITSALRLIGPHAHGQAHAHADPRGPHVQTVQVLQLSALKGSGLETFWRTVNTFREQRQASGALAARRHAQDQAWMWERIEAGCANA